MSETKELTKEDKIKKLLKTANEKDLQIICDGMDKPYIERIAKDAGIAHYSILTYREFIESRFTPINGKGLIGFKYLKYLDAVNLYGDNYNQPSFSSRTSRKTGNSYLSMNRRQDLPKRNFSHSRKATLIREFLF